MTILIVGGVFDEQGGRPSGFIDKFARFIGARDLFNGGHIDDLKLTTNLSHVTHVFWMADVPNSYPKLLPNLLEQNPKAVLIQSKNNRKGIYTRDQLYARMRKTGAEYLLEFTNGPNDQILSSILTIQGTLIKDSVDHIQVVADTFIDEFANCNMRRFPINDGNISIPTGQHPAAFGVQRKMHIHEGIDLYCPEGSHVNAIEDGIVVYNEPFTGPSVDSPWWNETYCVMIEGKSGVINYGEIANNSNLSVGDTVFAGQCVGSVKTVLKKDKGMPMSMLHLERYTIGTKKPIKEWSNGMAQPENLLNPTTMLFNARRV